MVLNHSFIFSLVIYEDKSEGNMKPEEIKKLLKQTQVNCFEFNQGYFVREVLKI